MSEKEAAPRGDREDGAQAAPAKGRDHWRSLEELADTAEFRQHVEREFPSALERISDPVSRRNFLGLMGAAVAMSGLVGCSRPLSKILPYSRMPEDVLPGVPRQYATLLPFRGMAEGVLVESHEGRPQKIEGNPKHPSSLGASHLFAQASILDLYDPDRSKYPVAEGRRRTWAEFADWARPKFRELRGTGGAGLRFLSANTASPALASLRDEIARAYPDARWFVYEPVNRDAALEGARIAFGRPLRTQLSLEQADVVVALDCDFLQTEPNSVRNARDFASRRRVAAESDTMNRLYAVESVFSVTGAMADHRLQSTTAGVAEFAKALAALTGSWPGELQFEADSSRDDAFDEATKRFVEAVAKDLVAHRGRAVVLAGSGQPAEVHALVHLMNRALGNVGPVVRYTEEPEPAGQTAGLGELVREMQGGAVDTLVVLGGNPAYDAPADLDFAAALAKVPHSVRLGLYEDETSAAAGWHLPQTHYLEAWGDGRAWDGTAAIGQPLIAPLYEGRSDLELIALLLDRPEQDGHDILRGLYAQRWNAGSLESRWTQALNDGVIANSAFPEAPASVDGAAVVRAWAARSAPVADEDELEVVFRPDQTLWDGRFANNGWLQELPDSMTKLVWDNAAVMAPATAQRIGAAEGDLVRVRVGEREAVFPVHIMPGQAPGSVTLSLGYGRARAGRIGNGVGVDAYALRTSTAPQTATAAVALAGGRHELVSTQNHHSMEGRPVVREATLEEWREEPHFAREMVEHPPLETLYTDREYDYSKGEQWGMSIDLNTCIGCNACMVACQSENNVAIVGKDEVRRGREMHWIRVDRYYAGDENDPQAVHQPVPCMQCENAPCESVCPVNATSHSDSGLNQMTYNRCIGTRYCNNNCPYKVRRFNYFNWNSGMTEVEKLVKNPDVTVRSRGVMEKCTYCIQRINRKRIEAKVAGRSVADGEIVTACQQACPTGSIVFGNVNDPDSEVSRLKAGSRTYGMLEELNTRPRTTYLAKIRNPNPELEHA